MERNCISPRQAEGLTLNALNSNLSLRHRRKGPREVSRKAFLSTAQAKSAANPKILGN